MKSFWLPRSPVRGSCPLFRVPGISKTAPLPRPEPGSESWFVGDGLGGDEIVVKTPDVGIQQLPNSFVALGFQNEASVVVFRDAVNDLRVRECGSIRVFLAGKRKNNSGVIAAHGGKLIGLFSSPDFETRPFAPEVDTRGGLDDIGNVGTADASSNFNEIEFSAGVRLQEFGVCHATHEAQAFQQIVIDFEKRSGFFRVPRQRTRCEHTARMRGIERRRAISMRLREDDGALRDHTVNVIDGARNELLEQIERLLVAEPIEPGPEFFGRMNLFHADAGGLRARLEQPGTGDARHEFPERGVVENVDEFGHQDARFSGLRAHGQLVAKITDSGEAHAGDAEMLAEAETFSMSNSSSATMRSMACDVAV